MIRIQGTRFGDVEVNDQTVIRFPQGILGFTSEREFVLLEDDPGRTIGFLQSVTSPDLSFPVVDAAPFSDACPELAPDKLATKLAMRDDITADDVAVLTIVAPNPTGERLEANLLAPLVIDTKTRCGKQILLDFRAFQGLHLVTLGSRVANATATAV